MPHRSLAAMVAALRELARHEDYRIGLLTMLRPGLAVVSASDRSYLRERLDTVIAAADFLEQLSPHEQQARALVMPVEKAALTA